MFDLWRSVSLHGHRLPAPDRWAATRQSEPMPCLPGLGAGGLRLRTPSIVSGTLRETLKSQSAVTSKSTWLRSSAPVRLAFSATPRQRHRVAHQASNVVSSVATRHDRRRCVRPTSATRIVKDEHPRFRCLPMLEQVASPTSVSCAVHAVAVRFGSSPSICRGRFVPAAALLAIYLWRFVVTRMRPIWLARRRGT